MEGAKLRYRRADLVLLRINEVLIEGLEKCAFVGYEVSETRFLQSLGFRAT